MQIIEPNLLGFTEKLHKDVENLDICLNEHKSNCVKVNEDIDGRLQGEIQVRFYKIYVYLLYSVFFINIIFTTSTFAYKKSVKIIPKLVEKIPRYQI